MTLLDSMKIIYTNNTKKAEFEEQIKILQDKIKTLDTETEVAKADLLNTMIEKELREYHEDNLVVFKSATVSKGYSKDEEAEILNILKEDGLNNCISIKESLSKSNLKKELKVNNSLQEKLANFGQEKVTEYVSVMTEESALLREAAMNKDKITRDK